MAFIISQGVTPDLISAQGFGDADPVASIQTTQHRVARNRRVELSLASTSSERATLRPFVKDNLPEGRYVDGSRVARTMARQLGRPSTGDEMRLALNFLKQQKLVDFAHVMLNLNEFVYLR